MNKHSRFFLPIGPQRSHTSIDSLLGEFLRYQYSATIKTHNITKVIENAEQLIHQHKGRIDHLDIRKTYGNVSAQMPREEYMVFRDALHDKYSRYALTENINEHNRLTTIFTLVQIIRSIVFRIQSRRGHIKQQ